MASLVRVISPCLIFFLGLLPIHGQVKEYGRVHESTTLVYPPARHAPIHKAGAVHLLAFMALIGRTDIRPSDPQGMASTRLRSTNDPLSRVDDDDLTVYGLNSGQNNIIFNSSMQSLDVYEGKGPRQKLKRPLGITAHSDGAVYVTDTGHHRVVRMHNPGSYLEFVDAFGKEGGSAGQFREPSGIALSEDGRLYVCDTGNNRVQVFDKQLRHLYSIGEKTDTAGMTTELFAPCAIAVASSADSDSYYKEDFLILVDMEHGRLQKLTTEGRFLAGVSASDYGYQRAYLTSVALDHYGNVWVTDLLNHCIHKFDRNLAYITSFGRIGDGEGEFIEPRGITIGKKYGQVFICDKFSAHYFHIGTDILNLDVSMQDSLIRFDFFLTENSRITARVTDSRGILIARLCSNKLMSQGSQVLLWNRRHSSFAMQSLVSYMNRDSLSEVSNIDRTKSDTLPGGLYKVIVEARTTYPYSRYFTKTVEVEFAF